MAVLLDLLRMLNMINMSTWSRFTRRSLLAPAALSFAAASLVALPTYGAEDDGYRECVQDLTDTGVTTEQATASCAGTRFPSALGECVADVSRVTDIGAADALEGCERSRRPEEVANCTIDIHQALLEQPSVNALEHCSRSLLPERYGTCVVDLGDEAQLAVDTALDTCVRAGFRPWTEAPRQ
ncbi:MAG: hypothetical protein AAF282_23055 [Cyanobacteria bacterium P01_A01_bin.15]